MLSIPPPNRPPTPASLGDLVDRIREIETRTRRVARVIPTGWVSMDEALDGGLMTGAVHEWFGDDGGSRLEWAPPVMILSHLARQAIHAGKERPWCVWVGQRIWPTPHGLIGSNTGDRALLAQSLFVNPANEAARTWAVDTALRVSGVVVVADGSLLTMATTRRLQLAAEAGGSVCLLARPAHERNELSAAYTRWRVARAVSAGEHPRFEIHLSRCKGVPAMCTRTVVVERCHDGAIVPVPADLPVRSCPAAAAS